MTDTVLVEIRLIVNNDLSVVISDHYDIEAAHEAV